MESAGQWRKSAILFFYFLVFNSTSSYHASFGNTVNVSSERQSADTVRQHTLPSWYYTSIDAVPKHDTVSIRSRNRWRTQMAFSKPVYSFEVREDTVPGTVVGKVETAFETLTPITYSVQEDDGENLFLLSPLSGEFLLSRSLDFEAQSFYILTVVIQQGDSQVSSVRVYVNVLDVNDNPPVFSQDTFSASLLEDTRVGTCFLSLNVSDKDDGANGDLKLKVVGGDEEEMFFINPTGSLCLNAELDREIQPLYNLTVTANDCVQPESLQFTSTALVIVVVEDVNDNAPWFVSANTVSVPEDTAVHSVIMTVHAKDEDAGYNGEVLYYLNNTSGDVFSIDNRSGIIYLEEALDREQEDILSITVTATDKGSPRMATTMNLTVHVTDVNDNDPEFSQSSYSVTVREDIPRGLSLLQVQAHDQDFGTNGQMRYILTQAGPFVVDAVRGVITVMDKLDRESDSNYTLTITAVDQGDIPRSATAAISVSVLDVNDFAPLFSPETLTIHVMENEEDPSQLIHQFSALDEDLGVNSQLTYFIQKGNSDGLFSITHNGTFQILHSLDRERESFYSVTIIAVDSGLAPLTGTLNVQVIVDDINDNHPEFTEEVYNTIVSEDSHTGTVFAMVTASDVDEGLSADIRYSMENLDVPFAIDETSGELFTTDVLDRETDSGTVFTSSALQGTEDIVVNVHVEDSGENPKFDVTTISIRFQNMSEFPQMNVAVLDDSLYEDEPVGTLVAVVSAESIRAEPVSFYLASGNFEDVFHVEQLSGALTVENPLDYENKKEFTLLIEARDSGLPPFSSFVEIHINISDVNDNFPQFTQPEYRCEVFENSPPSWVCDVLAIDADSGEYSTVQYNITEGNTENLFTIDPENGLLSTTESLDRENIAEFNLTVEAAELNNPLHKDRATVIVVVLDRNDNAPRFSQIFLTEVPEDSPVGHTILQVTSTDDDTGANAIINYSIIDESDYMPFNIDFTTGYITIERPLDREMQDIYILKVNANDSAWSISTDVTIVIADVNDNRPVFSDHFYTVVLPETKDKEVFVMQVLATDADIGQNREILYVIEPPSEEFWVNASSGEIYTKQPMMLQNSTFDIYQFTVTAFDCGSVPMYSNTTVTVRLEPYNYYPPIFLPFPPLIAIPYYMAVGTEVIQITAIDQDVNNASSVIEYDSNGGNASDFFWIQADNGKVVLYQSVFESENLVLTLLVIAKDQGSPSLSSQAEITFEITGKNQFPPSFRERNVTFSVPEDLTVGSVIGKIQAEDEDYGPNGAINYSITQENPYLPFSVGEASGLLILNRELDFETEVIYQLQIKAMDGGRVSKTGMLNVTVVVIDVNDNPPVFSSSEYTISVAENLEIGTNVLDVKTTDADSGANAQISYSLIAGHVDKFAIDSRNGSITTSEVFDYEREQLFDITIKASNNGDINEFTPTFRKKEFNFSVFKNVPVGTKIGEVTAIDDDRGSEEIYTTGSLRKQGNSRVVLKVMAKNSGVITGVGVDEALVHLSVIETNDAPEFTSTLYLVNVTEDTPVGTSVLTVTALDQDSVLDWNRVFISIESGNTNSSFAVDPSSGIFLVNSPLDRELLPMYNLTVLATDNGSPPATGTTNVIVTIDDVNDNAPKLTFTEAEVKENQPQGTIVAKFTATDSDLPPNQGPFTYWLVNPTAGSAFSLTTDGVLFTTRTIDREQTSVYQFLVAVRDAGIPLQSSTSMIQIKILDENDNPPLPRNIFIEVKYFGNSFPGGMIGNVDPEDQDESDEFSCAIKSGPLNMFTIPNNTCELRSSPFQGEATFNITIEATDHLHLPVNNSIYINYKGFTNASIDSCIFFYVLASSMEEFLTHKYLRFVKALDSLFNLQASKTHVFGIKRIGREILLLAAVKNYNGQYLSREVATGVSAGHKKLLETQGNVTISHITGDPCHTGPCKNGATCHKNVYISQDVAVLESPARFLIAPAQQASPGTLCDNDIDECEVDPCQNNGTCVNTLGGFYCHCQSGFSGFVCSTDVDECLKLKCQNGATCIPTQDGYRCQCVPGFEGVSGVHCEDHSYGFEQLSFMEFPPLDRRTNLISLEFATVQRNSLLLYNPGGSSSREFFALEILDGAIHLSYDLGSGPVRLQTNKQVADGYFHSVTVRRIGNMGSLHVDNCTDVENDGFCFSHSEGRSLARTLDVGSNMTFGGLRTFESILLHPAQIKTHDFVGCVRNIYVNGILLRPSMALATYNILDRTAACATDRWSDYFCECKSLFTGSNCTREMSEELVLRFDGNDYIEYVIKEQFKRDYLLKDLLDDEKKGNAKSQTAINIKFKTQDNGVLMFLIGQTGSTLLMIRDRKPVYISKYTLSGRLSEFTVDSPVTDGVWHVLSLVSNGQNTFLLLDGKAALNISEQSMDLTPASVEKIIFGAAVTDSNLQQSGFTGCVQYFNVTGYTLPVTGHSEMVDVWPSSTLVQSSCSSVDVCFPSPCSEEARKGPNRWRCGPTMQNRSCICLHNVSDHACDICISAKESHDQCSEEREQGSLPLWLIAVVLPVISILVFIGMCVVLYSEKQTQHDPMSADQQRLSVEFYCDASLSNVEPNSELDYYEIGSISSAFHSDATSLQLSWTKHLYSSKCVKAEPKRWADLRMLMAGFKKDSSSEEKAKSPMKPLDKQLLTETDAEEPRYRKLFLEPVQYLTFEEIRKITTPPEQKMSHRASLRSRPAKCITVIDVSSDSETDSTFTGVESECGQFSLIRARKYIQDQSSLSRCSFKQQRILPVSLFLNHTCQSAAGRHKAESSPSGVFEQWENILCMHLPFSRYAPVFEDIANLPSRPNHSYDMQSDIEVIL
ncbi:Protocadherin Fat 4 [Collichthys lucidus]|uniref:Protocadherin Fat 4 n=1 Tax=Collichthys lucidus TaxID=240159 RepID=A0A4U5V383_COLLU|nr:Protocadherin Fat 4 [Collichthys lucidus]